MADQKLQEAVTLEEFITSDNDPKPEQESSEMQTSYMELAAEPVVGVEGTATYVEMAPSGSETVYVTEPLPEGYTMVLGDDGQQYVTIVQDNQTYAIPLAEYQAMQQSGATTFAIQAADGVVEEEIPQMIMTHQNLTDHMTQHNLSDPEMAASIVVTAPTSDLVSAVHIEASTVESSVTQPALHTPSIKWGMTSGPQPQIKPTLTPTKFVSTTENDVDNRSFQPIRVDNWGIFLLSRLQAYFQKKEHCDLTIRFPSRNAQIKVHKLVVNACTDYFLNLEREGLMVDGAVDMTDNFSPEAVAPIIRFMYTGRLDVKMGMFSKLHTTANLMQMFVLTKLMDAQLSGPLLDPRKKGIKRKRMEDPVKQIKKIRRIEKKFSDDERKTKIQFAKMEALKIEQNDTLPGKKLPIWKKRILPEIPGAVTPPTKTSTPATTPTSKPSTANNSLSQRQLTPVARLPPGAQVLAVGRPGQPAPVLSHQEVIEASTSDQEFISPPRIKDESNSKTATGGNFVKAGCGGNLLKAYGKLKPDSEKPKVPRQIREIQQNLNFEKIRRTGTKNTAQPSDEPVRDMSVEEMKEFMDEQRKRFATLNDDYDDDYYDNDAEMDYGDDPNDEDDVAISQSPASHRDQSHVTTTPVLKHQTIITMQTPIQFVDATQSPSKPILKCSTENNPTEKTPTSLPRKSVRFSLRPGVVPTPKEIDSTSQVAEMSEIPSGPQKAKTEAISPTKTQTPQTSLPQKKRGRPPSVLKSPKESNTKSPKESTTESQKENVSDSLDTTVDEFSRAVQEEELAEKNLSATGKSSPVTLSNAPTISATAKSQLAKAPTSKPAVVKPLKEEPKSESAAQMQIVNEILRKNPDLLKNNKMVKLKVMSKDTNGKPVYKYITLRAQQPSKKSSNSTAQQEDNLSNSLGLRDVPKVCYTGRRGRPKTIKPGQFDPHEKERRQIEARLQKKMSAFGPKVASISGSNDKQKNLASSSTFQELDATMQHPVTSSSLNPSSEAEALSNVASGIAASLGLAAESAVATPQDFSELNNHETSETTMGPLSDLEHYEMQESETLLISYGRVEPSTDDGNISTHQDVEDLSVVESEKSKDLPTPTKSEPDSKGKEVVSQLAMDWDDEADEDVAETND